MIDNIITFITGLGLGIKELFNNLFVKQVIDPLTLEVTETLSDVMTIIFELLGVFVILALINHLVFYAKRKV